MDQGIKTYYEMLVGIIVQMVIFSVVGAFISKQYVIFPVSVIAGGCVAIGILRNMLKSIETILSLDPDTASKYGRRQATIRIAFMGLALCVAFYFGDRVNPWGVLLGVLSLKFTAFLQPLINKCFDLIIEKRRLKGK